MTAQLSEIFNNHHPTVDLADYHLYHIFTGAPDGERQPYVFEQKGDPDKCEVLTALSRGYVSIYELQSSGELCLIGFEYPGLERREPDEANELLQGDFWLEFRIGFSGDKLFIPFKNGKIVTDTNSWIEGKVEVKEQRKKDGWLSLIKEKLFTRA
jgi:hypothetical protein